MGVFHTESWQRFSLTPHMTGIFSDPTWVIKGDTDYVIQLSLSGATTFAANWSTPIEQTGMAPSIIQDPVTASKKRLCTYSSDATTVQSQRNGVVSLRRVFDSAKSKYVIGALVRFPAGSATQGNPTVAQAFGTTLCIVPTVQTRKIPGSHQFGATIPATDANQIFAMTTTYFTGKTPGAAVPANATSRFDAGITITSQNLFLSEPQPYNWNQDYFLEIEVDIPNSLVRVYIDDFLVAQPNWQSGWSSLANGFEFWLGQWNNFGGNPSMIGFGGLMLSDMYLIDAADSVAPTARLGMTTRVVGELPDADVDVDFTRPAGYPSNAAVVGQTIATQAGTGDYVSGEVVGDTDLYKVTNSEIGGVASKVHAVTVRMKAANASSAAHSVAAVINDGTNESAGAAKTLPTSVGFIASTTVFNKAPDGTLWTPIVAKNVTFGPKIIS